MNKQKIHLLAVDDDPGIREVLELFLSPKGFQVTTAEGAKEAAALLQTESFDLVILDLHLKDGDGWSLLADLRATQPDLPVVILTGDGYQESLLHKARALGARGFVSKEVFPSQVLVEIRHILHV